MNGNTRDGGSEAELDDRHSETAALEAEVATTATEAGTPIATVVVNRAHVSVLRDGVLARLDEAGEYRPLESVHEVVLGAIEGDGHEFERYRDVTVSVGVVGPDVVDRRGRAWFRVEIVPSGSASELVAGGGR